MHSAEQLSRREFLEKVRNTFVGAAGAIYFRDTSAPLTPASAESSTSFTTFLPNIPHQVEVTGDRITDVEAGETGILTPGPAIFRLDARKVNENAAAGSTVTAFAGTEGPYRNETFFAHPLMMTDGHLSLGRVELGTDSSEFRRLTDVVTPQKQTIDESLDDILQRTFQPLQEGAQSLQLLATSMTFDKDEVAHMREGLAQFNPITTEIEGLPISIVHRRAGLVLKYGIPSDIRLSALINNGVIAVEVATRDYEIPATFYQVAFLGNMSSNK